MNCCTAAWHSQNAWIVFNLLSSSVSCLAVFILVLFRTGHKDLLYYVYMWCVNILCILNNFSFKYQWALHMFIFNNLTSFFLFFFQTTLAHIIASTSKKNGSSRFVTLSATSASTNEVREVIKQAQNELRLCKRKTILFIDEIHRFNKSQQVEYWCNV